MTSVGLISDTHGLLDPRVLEHFAQVDEIWHAGDIGSYEVLDRLRHHRKKDGTPVIVRAVFGNIDGQDLRCELQEFYRFRVEQVEVLMTHIGGYPGRYAPQAKPKIAAFLREVHRLNISPNTGLITPLHHMGGVGGGSPLFVVGHSHILHVEYDRQLGMLCLNPGAAGKYGFHTVQTLLRFKIDGAKIVDLEVIELSRK